MEQLTIQLGRSGFRPLYRLDEINRCLACGGSHWYVGRVSAECAFCGAALPIAGRDGATRSRAA